VAVGQGEAAAKGYGGAPARLHSPCTTHGRSHVTVQVCEAGSREQLMQGTNG